MGNDFHLSSAVLMAMGLALFQGAAVAKDADEQAGPFIGVRASVFNPDSSRVLVVDNTAYAYRSHFKSPGFGLQYGVAFANQWQLRTYFDRIRMNAAEGQDNAWGHTYGVDALYTFDSGVYAGVGLNHTRTNVQQDPMLRATLGLTAELRDRFYTALEYSLQTESEFTDHQLNWSLNYRLGRDVSQQTLPREFRRRPQQRTEQAATSTSQPQRRAANTDAEGPPPQAATAQRNAVHKDLETLRQPPAELRFGFNAMQLDNAWYGAVGRIADLLHQRPALSVLLIGHTDLVGDEHYNDDLSQQRADHIAGLLINDFGVPAARVKTAALGARDPVINAINQGANSKNRRVEVLFQASDSDSDMVAAEGIPHTQG